MSYLSKIEVTTIHKRGTAKSRRTAAPMMAKRVMMDHLWFYSLLFPNISLKYWLSILSCFSRLIAASYTRLIKYIIMQNAKNSNISSPYALTIKDKLT